jgi:protein-disulfide isomerase
MSYLRVPVSSGDHVQGPNDAELTLVHYGDYEGPYCGRAYWMLEEIKRRFGARLRYVYRHFPLAEIHPHAIPAAEMAEAAGTQDRFWQMHDHLFRHQDQLDMPHLFEHARHMGLDMLRVQDELESEVHLERIREDFRGGVRSGVNGTPCFFINDVRHDGPWDVEPLASALERAARGVPRVSSDRPPGHA